MHASYRQVPLLFGLLLPTLIMTLPPVESAIAAEKTNKLEGSISQDITGQNGKIAWSHKGTHDNDTVHCDESLSGSVGPFVIGGANGGSMDSVSNKLCGQRQRSEWDLKAQFNAATGETTWTNKAGDVGSHGTVSASATAPNNVKVGTSTASTDFTTEGAVKFTASAKISSDAAKDDASAGGPSSIAAQADGSQAFTLDGASILSIMTRLFTEDRAFASITSSGLTLLARSGELAGFSATEINTIDPSQDLAWSASFDGSMLSVSGINSGLFSSIPGGVFLPLSDMPATDLTATIGPGLLGYDATAFASDVEVPEPSPFVLFVPPLVAVIGLRRRACQQLSSRINLDNEDGCLSSWHNHPESGNVGPPLNVAVRG